MITLPIFDTASAIALGNELLTHAEGVPKNRPIAEAIERLSQELKALRAADEARLDPAALADDDARSANLAASAAWRALHDVLRGWAGAPDAASDKIKEAKRIYEALFGDGLLFMRGPFKASWAEADKRLRWVEHQGGDKAIAALGGAELLAGVRATHTRYGESLGITKKRLPDPETPSLREPLDRFRAALRRYVVQVMAHGDSGSDRAKDRALDLLAPLARWQSARAKPARDSAPVLEPAPVVVRDEAPTPAPSAEEPPAIE